MTFGEVDPTPWTKPVAVVGQGPSLAGIDLSPLKGRCHVVAVKAAMFDVPWADCGVGIDMPRLIHWRDRIAQEVNLPVYWACDKSIITHQHVIPNVILVERINTEGLSDDPRILRGNGTSGYAGLNLAYLKLKSSPAAVRRIALLGFDHKPNGGNWHHDERNYWRYPRMPQQPARWQNWAVHYNGAAPQLAAAGIEVMNGAPDSLITAFRRVTPCNVIAWLLGETVQ